MTLPFTYLTWVQEWGTLHVLYQKVRVSLEHCYISTSQEWVMIQKSKFSLEALCCHLLDVSNFHTLRLKGLQQIFWWFWFKYTWLRAYPYPQGMIFFQIIYLHFETVGIVWYFQYLKLKSPIAIVLPFSVMKSWVVVSPSKDHSLYVISAFMSWILRSRWFLGFVNSKT